MADCDSLSFADADRFAHHNEVFPSSIQQAMAETQGCPRPQGQEAPEEKTLYSVTYNHPWRSTMYLELSTSMVRCTSIVKFKGEWRLRRTSWHGHWGIRGKHGASALQLCFSCRLKPRHHPVKRFTWAGVEDENVWENEEGIEIHAATAPMKYRFERKYRILEQEEVEREGSEESYQMICDEQASDYV